MLRTPITFLQCSTVKMLLKCAIAGCCLDHKDANESVTKFLVEFIKTARQQEVRKANEGMKDLLNLVSNGCELHQVVTRWPPHRNCELISLNQFPYAARIIVGHLSCSPVLFTCPVYLSCPPVLFTCPVHLSCSPVLPTCPVRLSCQPVLFTCPLHLSSSPVLHTCPVHLSSSPVLLTCPVHLSCSPVLFTCPTHLSHSSVPLTCPRL